MISILNDNISNLTVGSGIILTTNLVTARAIHGEL